jgi:putative ABC transport system permease protein
VFMFALIEGLKRDMVETIYTMVSGQIRIRTAAFDKNEVNNPLNLAVAAAAGVARLLEDDPDVRAVSPRITFPTALYREGKSFKGLGLGMDFDREERFQRFSKNIVKGSVPAAGAREIVLSSGLAEDMGIGVGDKITLYTKTATSGMNGMTLKVTGIASFSIAMFNSTYFFVPLDTAQRLLKMPDSATDILIRLNDGIDPGRKAPALSTALQERGMAGLLVQPWTAIGILPTYINLADSIYAIFAFFFLLIGSTVVINTTMMVIYERVREIGTMSAMGMTSGQVVGLFFMESIVISAIGSLFGMALGVAITLSLSVNGLDYTEMMKGIKMAMPSIYYPVLNVKSTLVAFLYSVAVSSMVSIIPSKRASRVEPVVALRSI